MTYDELVGILGADRAALAWLLMQIADADHEQYLVVRDRLLKLTGSQGSTEPET